MIFSHPAELISIAPKVALLGAHLPVKDCSPPHPKVIPQLGQIRAVGTQTPNPQLTDQISIFPAAAPLGAHLLAKDYFPLIQGLCLTQVGSELWGLKPQILS